MMTTNTNESITDISFINENDGIICGTVGYFAKTNDGGKSWTKLNVGVNHSFVAAFMLNKNSFFTSRIGIYQSLNSGNTFEEMGDLSNYSGSIFGIHFFDENNGIILKDGMISKTYNAGLNWEIVNNDSGYLNNLQMTSNNIGYASGGLVGDFNNFGEIYKTTDAGNTWEKIFETNSKINTVSFFNDYIGFAVTQNRELIKTNDGKNWNKIIDLGFFPINICFISENKGFSSTQDGKIYVTENGGKNWSNIYQADRAIVKLLVKNETLFAVGNNGLFLKKKL